jgi:hypothetical protein
MMLAWTFAASLLDEVARLLRAMQKHRYLAEVDHRIHFSVDRALSDIDVFAARAADFDRVRAASSDLSLGSRDPRLWRPATVEEVIQVLTAFWGPSEAGGARRERLIDVYRELGFEIPEHTPFESDPDRPPFPELVLLDWSLLPVDQLDAELHAGALAALEDAKEETSPSEPIYQEGPAISIVELCDGAPFGILSEDFFLWSEGPRAYADYVFRGVSKSAKLEEPPIGPFDDEGEGG